MYTYQSEMNDKLATAATITHPYPPSEGTGTNSYFTVFLPDSIVMSNISGSCFLFTVDTISGGCFVLGAEAIFYYPSPSIAQHIEVYYYLLVLYVKTVCMDGISH